MHKGRGGQNDTKGHKGKKGKTKMTCRHKKRREREKYNVRVPFFLLVVEIEIVMSTVYVLTIITLATLEEEEKRNISNHILCTHSNCDKSKREIETKSENTSFDNRTTTQSFPSIRLCVYCFLSLFLCVSTPKCKHIQIHIYIDTYVSNNSAAPWR